MIQAANNWPFNIGMFVMPIHDPDKSLTQCIQEDLELAEVCDRLGFHEFWAGEHHSSNVENIVMPEIFIARALGMTENIRLGPAPVCLQYHHPAHVAGRLAFLDHLAEGRLNICFGPGAIPTDMEMFGVDPKDAGARVAESMDMILSLWEQDPPYSVKGKFWNIDISQNIDLEMGMGPLPKPFQQPHPPISVPSISPNSQGIAKAAQRGFALFSHHMISTEVLKGQWATYSAGAAEVGRAATSRDWRVARNIYVAETTAEARELAQKNSMGKCIEYILELTRRGPGIGMWKRNPDQADSEVNIDYFIDEVIIAGDPDEVAHQIRALRDDVGDFGTLVLTAHDWDDKARWIKCLELFAEEVMPQL